MFVARIAPSSTMRSSSLKRCFFVGRSSTIDSITRSQSASAPRSVTALDPAEHGGALGVVELAAVDLLGERLLEPGDHRVGGGLRPAPQHHLDPGLAGDLGDAAAHDPRTDDSDALDHRVLLPVEKARRLPTGRSSSPREAGVSVPRWRAEHQPRGPSRSSAAANGVSTTRRWTAGSSRSAAGTEIVVLPTAAAYEHPERVGARGERSLPGPRGRAPERCNVLNRRDAEDPENVAAVETREVRVPRRRLADAPAFGAQGLVRSTRRCSPPTAAAR